MIGSRAELKEKAIEEVNENIELHRPFVDDIHIKCPHCGKEMTRVKDVIDCWFDSGSMPFAQYHFPFENKELFKKQFPADFIAEGVDQTRGWFYSLLVISTFITGVSPYKNVLVNDLLLDKNGNKMHKSRGNAISPFECIEKFGADAIRFYLMHTSPVWTPIKFDEDGVKEISSKFFNTLKNTYAFFAMYANTDKVDPKEYELNESALEEIDKWLISKYNKLIKAVTEGYENYDLTTVVRNLSTFVSEDLSNWYIRRNRRRFWKGELDESKKAVYKTTYDVLVGITKMLAPISSFISEEIYQKLTGNESVHLEDFPVCDESLINEVIEKRMDLVRDLISLGRNIREEAKIKVRQPISEALIDGSNKELIEDLTPLIIEELNVKNVLFIDNVDEYMNYSLKPNFKVAGPKFGPKIKDFGNALSNVSKEDITKLNNNEEINIDLNGENIIVNKELVDIRISAKEGFNVAMENNNFIILNTELTKELINEGIAREIVSKVQTLRKDTGLDITDRINLLYSGDETIKEVINSFEQYIKSEVLALEIREEKVGDFTEINGHDITLSVEKA